MPRLLSLQDDEYFLKSASINNTGASDFVCHGFKAAFILLASGGVGKQKLTYYNATYTIHRMCFYLLVLLNWL